MKDVKILQLRSLCSAVYFPFQIPGYTPGPPFKDPAYAADSGVFRTEISIPCPECIAECIALSNEFPYSRKKCQ